jgi:Bifunctional DNA primase/polymerase, N-terminal
MGYQNDKTPAGETTGVNGVSDGGALNCPHTTVNGGAGKAQSAAERLFVCGGENLADAGLRAAKRGWKIFPCNGKKEPLTSHGFKDATTDEAIIRVWAKSWPGSSWGRALEASVLVIDLDMKHGKNGIREFERLQGCKPEQFVAPRVATATGGLHIYTDAAGRDFKNTTDKIAPGVDTKTDGGYVIIPSGDGSYRWLTDPDTPKPPAPKWAEAALRRDTDTNSNSEGASSHYEWPPGFGQEKLNYFCKLVREAQEGHWDETRRKVFKFGRWAGGGAIDINVALEALINAARECRAPRDYLENVKRAFLNGVKEPEGPPDEGVSLNDFRAYMPRHSYIYVPTRELWPASSVNARIASIPVFNDGEPVLDKNGRQVRINASTWLDQNRPVEQMTWAPGENMLIEGRLISEGGWIERDGVTCFNLYRPPTIEPGDAAKVGPWLDHVRKVFGDDTEHIIKWCAQRVQHPEIKINHALVMGSEKHGVGKDAALEPVKRTIGPWNFGEVNPQQLLGRFNGFLKRVILRVNEVRDLGDVSRYSFYDHTKLYTASPPDALLVDEKNLREHSILNCVGLILTTNYKTTGIYLPAEDRRHYVAWSNLGPEDFAEGYWNKLFGWYDEDGDRHVAAYLAGYNLCGFDPKAPPPKTQAFWDIVDANRSPVDAELADVLDELDNPAAVTLEQVITKAKRKFADWLDDPKNQRAIPHRFEKCGYVSVRKPDRNDNLWRINKKRHVVYVLSDLSYREQLEAAENLARNYEVKM